MLKAREFLPSGDRAMNVSLTPELESFVNQKVASGLYPTASDVIRDGLRLLQEHEEQQWKLDELRQEVAIGVAEADRGETAPLSAAEILAEVSQSRRGRAGKSS